MQNREPSIHAASGSTSALSEAFRDVPEEHLAELESCLRARTLRRGEVLVREGEDADALYVVASGRFSVETSGQRLADVGSGLPIGEVAFFADGKRTATVTALRDSIVLQLARADFNALTRRHPAILKPIAATLARRLAAVTSGEAVRRLSNPRTIAIVRAGNAPMPNLFREGWVKALARFGRVFSIDSQTIAERFSSDVDLDSGTVTSWLNRQESHNHYVLYFADAELTAFSRKAIRQADQVMLVGRFRAGDDAASALPNSSERFAFEIHVSDALRLVLLHEDRAPIFGTARWLNTRPVTRHHHLVVGSDADYDRLARFLSGNALGFVAAGGGALCAAHIGVYKALLEGGLRPDLVGGTSGGAAMAAAFAKGATPEEVSRGTADIFLTARALRHPTWPRYSLLDHTVFDRALRAHFGETEIEDLWTGYFAVSTCLASNSLCLLTRGPVWKAVRATSSIPGLLPPVYCEDGRMLVDGSLLDNVPIRPMRALKTGPNIVVNLRSEDVRSEIIDYAALPSRGQLLLQLLNPFGRGSLPNAPNVASVLMRSLMVRRERIADTLEDEDLLIAPPLPEDVGVMDWHRHLELATRAYDYTAKLIDDLRAHGHPLFRGF